MPPKHIAFYAPMKAPTHPTASGDRTIARLLMKALEGLGHQVTLASEWRTYDGTGNPLTQNSWQQQQATKLPQVRKHFPTKPDLWFTYHVYHKAPDLLGPVLSKEWNIPYLIAEASLADKQADGPWQQGYHAARLALKAANLVITLNPQDAPALAKGGIRQEPLLPFTGLTPPPYKERDPARLITVAMQRPGAKQRSYEVLFSALEQVSLPWQLDVVGDGACHSDLKQQAQKFGPNVCFHGTLSAQQLLPLWQQAGLFVWPALEEAICLAGLEAQTYGLPVLMGATPGIAQYCQSGRTGWLVPNPTPETFARKLTEMLQAPQQTQQLGQAAYQHCQQHHTLAAAQRQLRDILSAFL